MSEKELKITGALERAALSYAAQPGSPSAVRSPMLTHRCGVWVALLGRNVREGIAGMGPSVEAALRAFDVQYHSALRLPAMRWPPQILPPPHQKFIQLNSARPAYEIVVLK